MDSFGRPWSHVHTYIHMYIILFIKIAFVSRIFCPWRKCSFSLSTAYVRNKTVMLLFCLIMMKCFSFKSKNVEELRIFEAIRTRDFLLHQQVIYHHLHRFPYLRDNIKLFLMLLRHTQRHLLLSQLSKYLGVIFVLRIHTKTSVLCKNFIRILVHTCI
jgi:hypothetical protein